MKKLLTTLAATAALTGASSAVILVGQDPLATSNAGDGWSGITVLTTPISAPAATTPSAQVTNWNYWDGRGNGQVAVTPLLIENVGGVYSVIGVGTPNTAASGGLQSGLSFGLTSGTDTVDTASGNTYHAGFFQADPTTPDDANDGTIGYAGAGGLGMFQMNVLDSFVATPGFVVTSGHASAAGGRLYNANFEYVPVPEPSLFGLVGLGGLLLIFRRRRK